MNGPRFQLRYFLLAVAIAGVLWGMARGSSSIERGFDIPVVIHDLPDRLVVTDLSADVVNIRVLGSQVALRDIDTTNLEYALAVGDAQPGPAIYEVDLTPIEARLPRNVRIVSRSPASLEVKFEGRSRKSVKVRPDVEGEPAPGFVLTSVEVDPPRLWLQGARGDVLRLSEVVTETIDVTGLDKPTEREVKLSLGAGRVWKEESGPVKVKLQIDPAPPEPPAEAPPADTKNRR
jgi:YbbR domain-containing protein